MKLDNFLPNTEEADRQVDPILTQMNPFDTLKHSLPSDLFPSGSPTSILYAFLIFHKCYMTHPSHTLGFVHPNNM